MMKKVALFGGLLALVGVSAAFAQGQFPGYPLATASPPAGSVATLPLTGIEQIPADTLLSGGVNPQTEVIQTQQLKAYVLTSPVITGSVTLPTYTIATLPTCTAALQGALVSVSNGTAYGTGTYGSAVSATGAVTRVVACTNTGGATTYAWAYN
jgi:hypothetical protein